MKKGRLALVMFLAILLAPPVAGFFELLQISLMQARDGGSFTMAGFLISLLFAMVFSYSFGFLPALIVGGYFAWVIVNRKTFVFWKCYTISFAVTALFLLPLFFAGRIAFIISILISMTASFFITYRFIKKLLPWAGTSLIEPTKAGNP